MPAREVVKYPHPNLAIPAQLVTEFNDELQQLIDDMFETMYLNDGIGLAATQINVHKHVMVIDIDQDKKQQYVFINTQIVEQSGHKKMSEGCLSVPTIYQEVDRYTDVKIKALDRFGKPVELAATGKLAHCLQHEVDHLNGKLFIDRLSPLKRQRVDKKFTKISRWQ